MTPSITSIGEHALLLELPLPVTPAYPALIRHWQDTLTQAYPHCQDTVAGYRNLLAIFAGTPPEPRVIESLLARSPMPELDNAPDTIIDIPACYHPALAPDLLPLAEAKNMTVEEFIARHSTPLYTVHCIGFIPGFPFLGEVDPRIAAPRHGTPRREVAAGSVGIAGQQTGIYPKNSPGGWQIIARTPLPLYQPEQGLYSRFAIGMRVRFVPISLDDYHARTL
ncbi:MAG: allophanate hydrolase subunit 1 [Cardiobacteriaceae bacterium]|nr:allophanate hydrolase subunit 1 [Cardiobacteriaceae bacterium]